MKQEWILVSMRLIRQSLSQENLNLTQFASQISLSNSPTTYSWSVHNHAINLLFTYCVHGACSIMDKDQSTNG